MMTNPIGGLTANSAAYNMMRSSNALLGLCSFKGGNSAALLAKEKSLTLSMLNDSINYRAGLLMQETQDKIIKDKIKRSFSIFA